MRHMAKILAGTILSLGIIACASPPSAEALATADYGPKPDIATAEAAAKSVILLRLKDPGSAQIGFASPQKGWFRKGFGTPRFAWHLPAAVNAKNSYGGYTGSKSWSFFFRGNRLVGYGAPHTSFGRYGSSTSLIYVELPGADGSLDSDPVETVTTSSTAPGLDLSKESFGRLELGMSYQTVCTELGGLGDLQSESGHSKMYKWTTSISGSPRIITCIFTDDALTQRTQFGLD